MMTNTKPRILKYDNVKLLAIVLVVIGSFAEEFTDHSDMFRSWFIFSYSFTAPLFVFLSGLFQKQYTKERRPDVHKITFYLLLGFLLKLMIWLVRILDGDDTKLNLIGGSGMEWYLFVIAAYMAVMLPLSKVNRYVMLAISVAAGVAAGFLPLDDTLYLMRFLVFLPFYVAGYYLSPIKVRRFTHRLNVKLAGIAFIFIYFVLCFQERDTLYPLIYVFTGQCPYAQVPLAGCTFWHRLLCYGVSAVLIISVMACMPNRRFPVLTRMGTNTLGVYFWHYPLVLLLWYWGIMDLFMPLGDPLWKYVLLVAAIALALILSLSVFTLPLRKLGELIRRVPVKACLIADGAAILLAFILQFTIL